MLTDIHTEQIEHLNSITAGILSDGMGEGSALDLYDMFNVPNDKKLDPFDPSAIPELLGKLGSKLKERMGKSGSSQPAEKLKKASTKAMGKLYGMKDFDHYFET